MDGVADLRRRMRDRPLHPELGVPRVRGFRGRLGGPGQREVLHGRLDGARVHRNGRKLQDMKEITMST